MACKKLQSVGKLLRNHCIEYRWGFPAKLLITKEYNSFTVSSVEEGLHLAKKWSLLPPAGTAYLQTLPELHGFWMGNGFRMSQLWPTLCAPLSLSEAISLQKAKLLSTGSLSPYGWIPPYCWVWHMLPSEFFMTVFFFVLMFCVFLLFKYTSMPPELFRCFYGHKINTQDNTFPLSWTDFVESAYHCSSGTVW